MVFLIACTAALPAEAGHWAVAFWRSLCQEEAANNLFVRVWTFNEAGSPVGGVQIATPTLTATTESNGRVDFTMSTGSEYPCKVNQAGSTSDISPPMSTGRYPNWGHYSYEVGFMYKSDINNPGTFDTNLVCGPAPPLGSTTSNAPCTASLAYNSFDPCNWSSDVGARDLPTAGWGEHMQSFVPNANRVACVQFHPTVGGVNQPIQFTVEIHSGSPTGPVIATKTSSTHYNQDWWVVPFGTSSCAVTPGQTYYARVYTSGGFNAYYMNRDFSPAGGYSAGLAIGQAYWRANSSSAWGAAPDPDLKGFVCCCSAEQAIYISNVVATASAASATITWTTDVASTSRVDYGITSAYGNYVYDSSLVTSHSLTLAGLRGGTIYHFKITSTRSGSNDGVTADSAFVTNSVNPNMLTNGGFEARDAYNERTLAPWVKFGDFQNNNRSDGLGPWCTGKCPAEGSCDFVSICSYCTRNGGAYQRVSGAAPGAVYTALMTYYTWQQGGADSDDACQIGIDPLGGTNPLAASIIWSPELSSQDVWSTYSLSATAQNSTITVFLRAIQRWGLQWNQCGFDDIRLTGPAGGSIPTVKGLVNGMLVALSGKSVSATSAQIGAYYVQEAGRTNGVRVEAISGSANLNDQANVTGWLKTMNGERIIFDASITSTGSSPARPVALTNRDLGGKDFNSLAKGATGKCGPNNVGLLVKTFGKVSSPGGGLFYITDGSGAVVKVDASAAGTLPNANEYVAVTGICRLELSGSSYVPYVKLRQTGDWRKMN